MTETQPNGTGGMPSFDALVVPPAPDFTSEALRGGMQRLLAENVGRFVVCEFFFGGETRDSRAGILHDVGESYLVLYDDDSQGYLVCDAAPLRFVTFGAPERQPFGEPQPEAPQPQESQPEAPNPLQQTPSQSQNSQSQPQPSPLPPLGGVQAVNAISQAKAAFNYTKRRARR